MTWWGEIWIWLESRELRKQDKILESIAFFAWWSLWMWMETFHASLPRWNRRCNPDQAQQSPGKCPRLLILLGPSQKSLFSPPQPEQNKHITVTTCFNAQGREINILCKSSQNKLTLQYFALCNIIMFCEFLSLILTSLSPNFKFQLSSKTPKVKI